MPTVLARLERRPALRWATCALTQLGFVRLSSNPKIVEVRKTPAEAVALLADLIHDRQHTYLETLPALPHTASVSTFIYLSPPPAKRRRKAPP
jgi:predicted nucleic acid-binding protein